jgi:hypothetical protein
MGFRLLGFLFGQKPNEQFVSNRITGDIGIGHQPSEEREVFAMDEVIHLDPQFLKRRATN